MILGTSTHHKEAGVGEANALLEDGYAQSVTPAVAALKERRATPTSFGRWHTRYFRSATRPLHISEIHEQFVARGYTIPGSGTPFNILAHLVNDKSFVRVARGTYAQAGSVPPEQVLPRPKERPGTAGERRNPQCARSGRGIKDGIKTTTRSGEIFGPESGPFGSDGFVVSAAGKAAALLRELGRGGIHVLSRTISVGGISAMAQFPRYRKGLGPLQDR